ncbi:translation elongation factor Ts [Propionicicella superfundia]|uniref:translation elongation factor Ts n=1 Tax=Propionicicella superfundia TaxID=348582 RepID=UPI00048E77CC|nr:translation elongation factor Ts [Propionicicella superfundia]
MAITATDVKKLRDATGAGMMDAKKALTESEGDFEKAIELLRITGLAKAANRSDREASNGIVASSAGSLIHLGAETDFVAKMDEFIRLADEIAEVVATQGAGNLEDALLLPLHDRTVGDAVADLAATSGEKIELKNVATFAEPTVVYLHRRSQDLPPQVGVLVEYSGGDADLVRKVAMQIASQMPQYVTREDIPADVIENERRVAELTAREEGKPDNIIPRVVDGRLNGFYKEVCLVEQPWVLDDKQVVGKVLAAAGVTVTRFARFAAGGK